MYFGSEANASKARVKIWQSRAGTKSKAERMVSVRRDLPMLEPPPAGRPALAATRVRLATVAAKYNWNFVLARPKYLDRIDQYSACGCEVVVTNPIEDVPAMRQDLEVDRNALWERIRDLNGYDLALDPAGTPPTS